PDHIAFEAASVAFLRHSRFLVASKAYHDVFPAPMIERLKQLNCPTALGIRTEADRCAAHRDVDLAVRLRVLAEVEKREGRAAWRSPGCPAVRLRVLAEVEKREGKPTTEN